MYTFSFLVPNIQHDLPPMHEENFAHILDLQGRNPRHTMYIKYWYAHPQDVLYGFCCMETSSVSQRISSVWSLEVGLASTLAARFIGIVLCPRKTLLLSAFKFRLSAQIHTARYFETFLTQRNVCVNEYAALQKTKDKTINSGFAAHRGLVLIGDIHN